MNLLIVKDKKHCVCTLIVHMSNHSGWVCWVPRPLLVVCSFVRSRLEAGLNSFCCHSLAVLDRKRNTSFPSVVRILSHLCGKRK